MNRRTVISLGGMALIAIASVLYMNTLGLGLRAGVQTGMNRVEMAAENTNGLVVGSNVLLRGIPIGKVTRISPSADRVEIGWEYHRDYHIPVGARFRIDNLSALGEPYIAVLPTTESGPYLQDGADIPETAVTVPTTITELSVRVTKFLEQIPPQRVQRIFQVLDTALPRDAEVVQVLNHAGALLASTMVTDNSELAELLVTAQALLSDSSWLPPSLAATTPDLVGFGQGLTGVLNAGHDATIIAPLPDGVGVGVGPFIAHLQRFLDRTAPDLKILGTGILPAARSGAAAIRTVDIGRLLDTALAATRGDSLVVREMRTRNSRAKKTENEKGRK